MIHQLAATYGERLNERKAFLEGLFETMRQYNTQAAAFGHNAALLEEKVEGPTLVHSAPEVEELIQKVKTEHIPALNVLEEDFNGRGHYAIGATRLRSDV